MFDMRHMTDKVLHLLPDSESLFSACGEGKKVEKGQFQCKQVETERMSECQLQICV